MGVMVIKGHSIFPKAQGQKHFHKMFNVISGHSLEGGSAELQSAYYTTPPGWADRFWVIITTDNNVDSDTNKILKLWNLTEKDE